MSQPRKMTTDRQKSSLIVENSVTTHGEKVAAKLAGRDQGLSAANAAPDFLAALLFLQGLLAEARRNLLGADEAHRTELAGDDGSRKERDAASAVLAALIQKLRDAFRAAYGPVKSKELGFDSRLSREPVAVLAQGKRLLTALRPDQTLPDSETPGVKLDREVLVPPLEAAVARLEAALFEVAREKTKADHTQVAKNLAMEEFDATFLRVSRSLEAMYTLAGELELAARVRPSRRRPGRTETVGKKTAPGAPAPEPEPQPAPQPVGFAPPIPND